MTTGTNFVSRSSRLARCCRQVRAPSHCSFVFASPHIFPILYSSYVICLFCTSRIYFIFSLAMISFNHIHLFFSFLKANLLFFNSFCFFSLSPAVVILYRESFLMYSFFSLSPPAPNNNGPPPSSHAHRTHSNPIEIFPADGRPKAISKGLCLDYNYTKLFSLYFIS